MPGYRLSRPAGGFRFYPFCTPITRERQRGKERSAPRDSIAGTLHRNRLDFVGLHESFVAEKEDEDHACHEPPDVGKERHPARFLADGERTAQVLNQQDVAEHELGGVRDLYKIRTSDDKES